MPIIAFEFDEIDIDLGLACLPVPTVPPTLDIDDDQVGGGKVVCSGCVTAFEPQKKQPLPEVDIQCVQRSWFARHACLPFFFVCVWFCVVVHAKYGMCFRVFLCCCTSTKWCVCFRSVFFCYLFGVGRFLRRCSVLFFALFGVCRVPFFLRTICTGTNLVYPYTKNVLQLFFGACGHALVGVSRGCVWRLSSVQVLDGVDRPTEKCVNGPRVTNMIHRLVSKSKSKVRVTAVKGERRGEGARHGDRHDPQAGE